MKAELQKKLYDKYPAIFIKNELPMTETCMCWGIECGDGWYDLMDNLCARLNDICEKYDVKIVADQVKEKYGTLRFYYSVEFGKRWTRKFSRMSNFLHTISSHLSYTRFPKLVNYINHMYCDARDKEWQLDNQVYITKHCNGWIKHGQFMLAYRGVYDLIDGVISNFDDFSSMVCEKCGSTVGVESTKGWISYQCTVCRNKRNDEQSQAGK